MTKHNNLKTVNTFRKQMKGDREQMSKQKLKTKRGITLIALVITIIVMLILVVATVTVALNGGLFQSAKKATADTETARKEESELSSGRVKIDGLWYNSVEDYAAGVPSKDQPLTSYDKAGKEDGYLTENAEFTDGEYTAVIPKGFKISEVDGEKQISTGLVIKDAEGNEFVWIPIKEDLGESYYTSSFYLEPTVLEGTDSDSKFIWDSQEELNYYYGYTDESSHTPYYDYNDFKYELEYAEMVRQVNKYHGFYIGRYETTIDSSGNIGSKAGETVLTAETKLIQAPIGASATSGQGSYRWWGLYAEQKKANVPDNGSNVQTAMIYGVLWDKTMNFIDEKQPDYGTSTAHSEWHTFSPFVTKSGQRTIGLSTQDKALNIWDLESNAKEWTQTSTGSSSDWRDFRGRFLER